MIEAPKVYYFNDFTKVEHQEFNTKSGRILKRGDKCGKSNSKKVYEFYSYVETYLGKQMETVEKSWVNLTLNNAFVSVSPEDVKIGAAARK